MKENISSLFSVKNIVTYNSKGDIMFNGYTRDDITSTDLPLSYYEIACTPRLIDISKKQEIKPEKIHKIIKEILTCNICLQIYNDPVNIKNCLHKFCRKCIEDFNRRIKKECAICRQNIETRRLLREDNKIKNIIRCLVPSVDKYNEAEEKLFHQCIKKTFSSFHNESTSIKREINKITNTKTINIDGKEKNDIIPHEKPKIFQINEDKSNANLRTFKEDTMYLERKTIRKDEKNLESVIEFTSTKISQGKFISNIIKEKINIPVKLSYLDDHDQPLHFWKKQIVVTNDNLLLESISRYIIEKMNLTPRETYRISFLIKDTNNNLVDIPHSNSIQNIMKRFHKLEELILFFKIKQR